MATKKKHLEHNRFLKLSLKKNRLLEDAKNNRSSDVIILDESFDNFRSEFHRNISSEKIIYSPIVINDSSELSDNDLPEINLNEKEPSRNGNVSFNASHNSPITPKESQPSIGGWSPAQNIITATPRNNSLPSTPRDEANESMEQCSIKKIQQSQKKILNEIYGTSWKSIPKLFKTLLDKHDNFDGVSKKLRFDDDESDKENIRHDLKMNRMLYLTNSDVKRNESNYNDISKKSRKKLYTEKVPNTPEVTKTKVKTRNVNSTSKKTNIKKGMTITEMVEVMKADNLTEKLGNSTKNNEKLTAKSKSKGNSLNSQYDSDVSTKKIDWSVSSTKNFDRNDISSKNINRNDVSSKKDDKIDISTRKVDKTDISAKKGDRSDILSNKIDNVDILTKKLDKVKVSSNSKVSHGDKVQRLSFIGSLADNVPSWRIHPEAFQYIDNYKTEKEQLTRRLFTEFNKAVFDDAMDADMLIVWDSKLRSTAGTTTNRLIKTASGDRIRTSSIKLSSKVLDAPARLRDTLIHELCHAATWLIDAELRAGHGPLWKKWATRALRVYPELGEISRCHDMEIHFKYCYKCTKCGYSIKRHSKSIDVTKKCCGYCRGTFELVLNKKNKDGRIISTPARKGNTNEFAQYVKENYATQKDGTKTHAQVMKLLGEQFSAKKNKNV